MYRVGKSATETEAETWESDPISVRSCARMTGCFGRTHVFITVRADRQLRATYCTSQGHSCGNEAALNKFFRVSQRAQCPGANGRGCLAVLKACSDNCYYPVQPSFENLLTASRNAFITQHGCC